MPAPNGKGYKQLTEKDKIEIVEAFHSGKTVAEIVRELKTTRRAVPQVLKEFELPTKRKNRYHLNENYFKEIDTPEKSYWLGLIASDGCITSKNYFAIALKDKDLLERLKDALEFTGDVYIPKTKKGTYYRINFSSKIMCDDLRRHGIKENKSKSYDKLPNIRKGLIRHFIRAYFDGDGCISSSVSTTHINGKKYKNNNYQAYIVATEGFCKEFQKLLYEETGYECRIKDSRTPEMKYAKIFDNQCLYDFYWYIYHNCDLYLERKHDKWKEFLGSLEERSSWKNRVNRYNRGGK